MTGNELAERVAHREGMKEEVSIAQVREVMRCLADEIVSSDDAVHAWAKWLDVAMERLEAGDAAR